MGPGEGIIRTVVVHRVCQSANTATSSLFIVFCLSLVFLEAVEDLTAKTQE